ncbi:MAG: PDDEXK nuclease domain-containing protein, partial [Gammaproteobacteria bacterium]
LTIDNQQEREFYAELCQHENWSTRALKEKIASRLFQRTALSKHPDTLIEKELKALRKGQTISPALILRDPYILDFLQLPGQFSESDLEQAILNELSLFLHELGSDFCFIARQKRISIGKKDHYLDLLFYHRTLRRLIALELKLDAFQPAHKGQMELYLKWLDKNERRPGEEAPLGIILCAQKDQEEIELLELNKSDIHVAEYWLSFPSKEWLEEKLQLAITLAKERLIEQKTIE